MPKPALVQDAETPQARPTRRRQHDLAAYAVAVRRLVHVHAEVDIGDKKAACELFELAPLLVGIDAAEDYVATAQGLDHLLPARPARRYPRIGIDAADDPLGDCRFSTGRFHIRRSAAEQTVPIPRLDDVGVDDDEFRSAKMRELMHEMRTTPAKTNNSDLDRGEEGVTLRSEKALARKPRIH